MTVCHIIMIIQTYGPCLDFITLAILKLLKAGLQPKFLKKAE